MCLLLKRIEMQGFKSFADKTVLEFVNGATAVVGPNGSGKSNISDAIRWVIGEMSAKSLRGSNMQDVIFAGTETRKPVNYAEVSLVLDNSTHVFDIEFDEVIVTRRLFRSGESVYQINRANCRLKDIHELFMDTGLGKDGYSIIGQGNVSQILSTKAEDRRSLFEEAAGISKYKYKKDEAQKKLANTEENLVRINDITVELEGQLNPLKNQSEKARKYLELYGEFKTLDVNLSLITLEKNKSALEEADKLYAAAEDELNELRDKESETEAKITALYEEQKKSDDEKNEKNSLLRENEAKGTTNKNEISIADNNIKHNNSLIKRIDDEIISLKAKSEEYTNQIGEIKNSIADTEAKAHIMLSETETARDEISQISDKQESLYKRIEELRAEVVEKSNSAAAKRAEVSGIETLRKSFLERRETVESEIKSHKEGIESTKAEIEEDTRQIAQKKEKLEKIKASVEAKQKSADELTNTINTLLGSINRINADYQAKSSKKRMLEGMENDYVGFAKSVKSVLKADDLKSYAIYGTVSGLIDVKKEYVVAIETALGGAMQNIIVESEEDAKAAIGFLRKNAAGRATFLPISSVRGKTLDNVNEVRKSKGYIGLASELVSYDKKYDGIIKSLLGRVVVVDNIDNAIALSKNFGYRFKTVTVEGDVLNAGGSMSGGSVNKQSGFLSRAAEIKTLSEEISALSAKLHEEQEKKEKSEQDKKIIEGQLSSYIPIMREYEDEILRLENTCEHLKSGLESGGNAEKNYTIELSQIEENLSSTSDEIAQLLSSVRSLENECATMQSEIESLEEEHSKVLEAKDSRSDEIMDQTMKIASMQQEAKQNQQKINELLAEIERIKLDIEAKEQDKTEIIKDNERLSAEKEERKERTSEIEKLSEEYKTQIKAIDEQKEKIVETLKNIQNSNRELTDKLLNLQQELSRVDGRRIKLSSERENILNRLWEDYELTYSSAEEIRSEVEDERAAFKRLGELKSGIKALGSVNMDAIEEYKAVKERYEFLTAQKSDLEKSKANLNQIIDSMQELMQEHFGKQFKVINESFGEVFTELFGGGKGQLYLTEPDNMLESGIEIEVQLPGKGLQNINLYSGGEKSFIAIALLFAILKVKPTPFCILDEIDAALDDVNVSRFATYLKNYIDQTQFIVITHRRGTMEAANILYGVTMQEKGVSKLLSLLIDDVEDDMMK